MTAQGKQNVSGLCMGESIELHMIMLTNAAVQRLASPDGDQTWISVKYRCKSIQLESAMVGESYLLEKVGSKRHANYTLACSFSTLYLSASSTCASLGPTLYSLLVLVLVSSLVITSWEISIRLQSKSEMVCYA